jgi:hypothetical protein
LDLAKHELLDEQADSHLKDDMLRSPLGVKLNSLRAGHTMATAAIDFDIETLKAAVIRELDEHSRRPTELLITLGDNYPDNRIKEAVLRLLQEGRVELTSDRHLQISHHAA